MANDDVGSLPDRFSSLPGNVIDGILSLLPLKDAVRTSCLSTNWKEKWVAVSNINVDENQFYERQKRELGAIVSYILARHEGNIQKFTLSIGRVKGCYMMKLWIWTLSEKGIQDLSLKIRNHRYGEVPCHLFSCQQLRKLKLYNFEIKLPHTFRGFQHLVSLKLKDIDIETSIFESLVAGCPLLEQLVLKDLSCVDHLHINVPNLKYFSFDGEFKSIRFKTPRLVVVSMDLYRIGTETTRFDVRYLICGLPLLLEELYVQCLFKRFLSAGNRLAEASTSYSHMKTLGLNEFCFRQVDEVSCLLSLIGCFPNLQILDITACECAKDGATSESVLKFWDDEKFFPCCLNQLRILRVRSLHGEDAELRFIKFVLANSPSLKEMIIEYAGHSCSDEAAVVTKLMCFPRCSNFEVKYIKRSTSSNSDDGGSSDYDGDNASDVSYSSDSD